MLISPSIEKIIQIIMSNLTQIRLSNENRLTANYTCSLKPKKAKPCDKREKRDTEKESDNEEEKKSKKRKNVRSMKAKIKELVGTSRPNTLSITM